MRKWKFGYNTSGFSREPSIEQMADILADTGYEVMEITITNEQLHPFQHPRTRFEQLRKYLDSKGLVPTVCTGGDPRMLSDCDDVPWIHELDNDGRALAVKFFEQMIPVTPLLGANIMMVHSGIVRREMDRSAHRARLMESLRRIVPLAEKHGVTLCMEYNPDMIFRTLDEFIVFKKEIASDAVQLCLDVGHTYCVNEGPIENIIERAAPYLKLIQLDEVRNSRDYHIAPMAPGGQVDFKAFFNAIDRVGYDGPVNFEYCCVREIEHACAQTTIDLLAQVRPDLKNRNGKVQEVVRKASAA